MGRGWEEQTEDSGSGVETGDYPRPSASRYGITFQQILLQGLSIPGSLSGLLISLAVGGWWQHVKLHDVSLWCWANLPPTLLRRDNSLGKHGKFPKNVFTNIFKSRPNNATASGGICCPIVCILHDFSFNRAMNISIYSLLAGCCSFPNCCFFSDICFCTIYPHQSVYLLLRLPRFTFFSTLIILHDWVVAISINWYVLMDFSIDGLAFEFLELRTNVGW